jgi:hypothetical protein
MRGVGREVHGEPTPATSQRGHSLEKRAPRVPGVIRADELYTIEEFVARTGLGESWRRRARRRGLRILYLNSRAFVSGRDFIDFVQHQATAEFRPKEKECSEFGTDGQDDVPTGLSGRSDPSGESK